MAKTKTIFFLLLIILLISSCTLDPVKKEQPPKKQVKDKMFLMGIGMVRLNWAAVDGDEIRFRYSDLGLPADFSTRERASFILDGTLAKGKYSVNGYLNYDPENRITEPPLDFLFTIKDKYRFLSVGDYRYGVLLDSIFSRYYHPFRGVILGTRSDKFGAEIAAGLSRGESGVEELPADSGSGPYYLINAPVLRGSELVYLVTKSNINPDLELKRTLLFRNRDYFFDYDRGSILFNYPLNPYDELGNPVVIEISYQFETLAGNFSRMVFGLRTYLSPFKNIKFSFSYITDADKSLSLDEALESNRGIYSFGLNVNSDPVVLFAEYSISSEPSQEKQTGIFAGGIVKLLQNIKVYFNTWSLDSDFPTFANHQLQYGYSLLQIFPGYAEKNIFLSPFQFTRNLGAELYPFSLARISVDENETHGYLEWADKNNSVNLGYGTREKLAISEFNDTFYLSLFHNGKKTKIWGKSGLTKNSDKENLFLDNQVFDLMFGIRQLLKGFKSGDLFVQVDLNNNWHDDYIDLSLDTYYQSYSVLTEFVNEREGYFAGYRFELKKDRENDQKLIHRNVFEIGLRRHIFKGIFLDSRYRREKSETEGEERESSILSLGGGLEFKKFRAMVRYETQVDKGSDLEGQRELISLYLYGTPLPRMNLSLRYYKQLGEDKGLLSLSETSEERMNLRFLWRPSDFLNIYSQWRYDTNIELFPPLDTTRSNSLASVNGLKLKISKRFEFLANYKQLKVWGPISNRKFTASAELGYLILKHFRLGIGAELIDYKDSNEPESEYHTWVGYFKLVAVY